MLFCLLESHAHQKSIAQKMFHSCAPRDDSSSLVSLPLVTKVSFQNWQEIQLKSHTINAQKYPAQFLSDLFKVCFGFG